MAIELTLPKTEGIVDPFNFVLPKLVSSMLGSHSISEWIRSFRTPVPLGGFTCTRKGFMNTVLISPLGYSPIYLTQRDSSPLEAVGFKNKEGELVETNRFNGQCPPKEVVHAGQTIDHRLLSMLALAFSALIGGVHQIPNLPSPIGKVTGSFFLQGLKVRGTISANGKHDPDSLPGSIHSPSTSTCVIPVSLSKILSQIKKSEKKRG